MVVTVFGDFSAFYLAERLPDFRNTETSRIIEQRSACRNLPKEERKFQLEVRMSCSKQVSLNSRNIWPFWIRIPGSLPNRISKFLQKSECNVLSLFANMRQHTHLPITCCEMLFSPYPNQPIKMSFGNQINRIFEHVAQLFSCRMLPFQVPELRQIFPRLEPLRGVTGRGESLFAEVRVRMSHQIFSYNRKTPQPRKRVRRKRRFVGSLRSGDLLSIIKQH